MNRKLIVGIKILMGSGFMLAVFVALSGNGVPEAVANQTAAAREEKTFDQKKALAALREHIAGQENRPAAEVFKNIRMFERMPAGRLLRVMEMGFMSIAGRGLHPLPGCRSTGQGG